MSRPKAKSPRPRPIAVRGLHLKRGSYVYQPPMVAGVRPSAIPLHTADLGEALQARQRILDIGYLERTTAPLRNQLDAWLRAKASSGEHRPATTSAHRRNLARFLAAFEGTAPDRITPAAILAWRASLVSERQADGQPALSIASVQAYVTSASALFAWLAGRGVLAANPFDAIPRRQLFEKVLPTKRGRFCEKSLRDQLIASATDPDLRAVLFLGFHAGLRRAEILAARPGWIIRDTSGRPTHLHVRPESGADGTRPFKTKNGHAKTIPLTDPLADFLAGFAAGREPYLIRPRSKGGRNVYRWDWRKAWETHMAANGCPWVTAHTMRHTFVTLLLSAPPERRPSLLHLERWTGTNTETLKKSYAHLIEDRELINASI